jgi:hypothetical protein
MFKIMLHQAGVAIGTELTAACRVSEFVFFGIIGDMTCVA